MATTAESISKGYATDATELSALEDYPEELGFSYKSFLCFPNDGSPRRSRAMRAGIGRKKVVESVIWESAGVASAA